MLLVGTVGFSYFSNISAGDAFYETLLVLLSHYDHYGFREPASRVLVVALILGSLLVVAYLLKWFAEYMIGLNDKLKRSQVKTKARRLKNHIIVCGLGRVGSQVAGELKSEGVAMVGIDKDPEKVKEALAAGMLAFVDDSTQDGVLETAGIASAQGLVSALGEDAQNMFVVLAARQLNPKLFIVSRANRADTEQKLIRAGADRVAMPYQIGGYHMATMVMRPGVVDFMDVLASHHSDDLQVEEVVIPPQSALNGSRLSHALEAHKFKVTVLAINGADGTSKVKPRGNETLYAGDSLILLGTREQLDAVSQAA